MEKDTKGLVRTGKEGKGQKRTEKETKGLIPPNEPHRLSNQKNFVYLAEIGD